MQAHLLLLTPEQLRLVHACQELFPVATKAAIQMFLQPEEPEVVELD